MQQRARGDESSGQGEGSSSSSSSSGSGSGSGSSSGSSSGMLGAVASGVNAVEKQVGKVTGEVDLPEFPTKELENLGSKVEAGAGRAESEGKDRAQEMGDRMSEQVRGAGQPAGRAGQMHGQAGQVQWGAGRAGLGALLTRGRQVDGCRQNRAGCNEAKGGTARTSLLQALGLHRCSVYSTTWPLVCRRQTSHMLGSTQE
jgi:hypothetical protein